MEAKNFMKAIVGLIMSFAIVSNLSAQIDSIQAEVSAVGGVGTAGYLPFHMGHNSFGKLDPNDQSGYLEGSVYYPILDKGNWLLETGIDFVVTSDLSKSLLHQGFLNLHWNDISLRLGKNEINNSNYNDELGSGSFFQSQNARTMTKVGAGIWDYTSVPFFPYLEVLGTFEVGRLDEDRPVTGAYYHEKSVYAKTAKLPVNPFFGISHNVLFGGTTEDGEELPSDFLKAVLARSAVNSGNASDSSNAAGAHFGIVDMGVEIPFGENKFKFSFQQPISDASGYQTNFTKNTDHIIILELKLEGNKFIKSIIYENINTTHQSGEGLTDPYINGRFQSFSNLINLPDYDAYIQEQFGITTNNITWKEFRDLVRTEANFGYAYGGRDDHYNNATFPFGNTFHRMVIGNPLMMTRDRFETITGETVSDPNFIVNNRIVAHHIGIGGQANKTKINIRATFTHNYGTYTGKYGGARRSWELDRDYYFRDILTMHYVSLELKRPGKNGFVYRLMLETDLAEFGNNHGILMGVTYRIK